MDYSLRVVASLQIAVMLVLFVDMGDLRIYGLMIAELFTGLVIFFVREHQAFRWAVSPR